MGLALRGQRAPYGWERDFEPISYKGCGFLYFRNSFIPFSPFGLFLFCVPQLAGCASVPVKKVPTPMPDIVKGFKSFKLDGSNTDWIDSGNRVAAGDSFTIIPPLVQA